MTYEAAVKHLYSRGFELAPRPGETTPNREFDLNQMRILADSLGSPQGRYPSILIAGTNGKGSTSATIASILNASGYKTGLYTSPHLSRINERIQTSGSGASNNQLVAITDDDFSRLYTQIDNVGTELTRKGTLSQSPSLFEVMTALAFRYFAEQQVDIAVLEVGLGGRLDASNIVQPLVSILTDIDLDHMEWLGDTVAKIAREKVGILRSEGILVTLPQHPEVDEVIEDVVTSLNVRRVNAADYLPSHDDQSSSSTNQYTIGVGIDHLRVNSPLAGQHQRRNLAIAIASAFELQRNHGFSRITSASIEQGIHQTYWPGRLEFMSGDNHSTILLDVAHNPAGIATLRLYLSSIFNSASGLPHQLIFGALRDKSIHEMAQKLFPLFRGSIDRIHLVAVNNPRAASLEELKAATDSIGAVTLMHASVADALKEAQETANSTIVIAGSLFLVGEARHLLLAGKS
jgi:dihydrofolate synthase / folylpolyglutamate synthase